jgi:monovalent cation/hydrogen antiporter
LENRLTTRLPTFSAIKSGTAMHSVLPFLLAMMVAIILLEMLADKLKIAYPVLLVVAGLLISFIPGLPTVRINPELIFFIFLPPLLFEAAWSISFKEMKRWWRIITSFAFLVVFFTAFSVAIFSQYLIPGFTLALGFLLGGIVSPPDAVSTGAITKFVRIPRTTRAVLEGESLLNDASSLIIFQFALIAVGTGQFVWQKATLNFFWMVTGGAGIGLVLAWLFVQAHKRLPTDASSDTVLTLIEPYILYWVAEQADASGVMAVVCGGLYMSNHRLQFLSSTSRIKTTNVWESFVFILNGLVFFIIGLDLPEIVTGLKADGIPLSTAINYGIGVTLVLIIARIVSSYAALIATLIFRPSVAPRFSSNRRRWLMPLLLGWTGMRGVVSLAAALSIPVMYDKVVVPHRSIILFITFMVILLTLLLQGLTLPYFIKRSRLFEFAAEEPKEESASQLQKGLRQHAYDFLNNIYQQDPKGHTGLQKLLHHWEDKMKDENNEWMSKDTKTIYMQMLESQRNYLIKKNKDVAVDEELIRQQLYQIDLDEEKMKMV